MRLGSLFELFSSLMSYLHDSIFFYWESSGVFVSFMAPH